MRGIDFQHHVGSHIPKQHVEDGEHGPAHFRLPALEHKSQPLEQVDAGALWDGIPAYVDVGPYEFQLPCSGSVRATGSDGDARANVGEAVEGLGVHRELSGSQYSTEQHQSD